METSEALLWTRQQQQKIDIDPEQQIYTPKIVDIAAASSSLHTRDSGHCCCCDGDAWRHLRLFFGHDKQQQKIDIDPEQQIYTPKIVDIAAAVMEMHGDI
ncbi:hypothetical protein LAZ67_3001656 [Cordylochernes scorpioides]|uniref:Uncharacterized protein n=1 Tax=Cordylochernes scorpioides TaxID=51811 RepID=A0ABY6K794_9ARAC|nr:hypothetical protein LAZ67_3001656 [Cordylochernes scorpioides]